MSSTRSTCAGLPTGQARGATRLEREDAGSTPIRYTLADTRFVTLQVRDLTMRVARLGTGPAVLFVHGWPGSWRSWRHQMVAMANAGYCALAPDMPGYGGSAQFERTEQYNLVNLAVQLVALTDALGVARPALVGHDWGGSIAWGAALLHPECFSCVCVLSAAYNPSAPVAPTVIYRKRFRDNFFYQLYFQEPGVAEAELDAAPAELLRRLYVSADTPLAEPDITEPLASAGGMIGRLGEPLQPPAWLEAEDLDYLVAEYARAGFRGGLSYYRNIDHNWELLRSHSERQIELDALFIAGAKDSVVTGSFGPEPDATLMASRLRRWIPHLQRVALLPDAGHWLQEEAPHQVNRELLEFMKGRLAN